MKKRTPTNMINEESSVYHRKTSEKNAVNENTIL